MKARLAKYHFVNMDIYGVSGLFKIKVYLSRLFGNEKLIFLSIGKPNPDFIQVSEASIRKNIQVLGMQKTYNNDYKYISIYENNSNSHSELLNMISSFAVVLLIKLKEDYSYEDVLKEYRRFKLFVPKVTLARYSKFISKGVEFNNVQNTVDVCFDDNDVQMANFFDCRIKESRNELDLYDSYKSYL